MSDDVTDTELDAAVAALDGHDLMPRSTALVVLTAAARVRCGHQTQSVAAELRAQADTFESWIDPGARLPDPHTLAVVVARLRARADELDPDGVTR